MLEEEGLMPRVDPELPVWGWEDSMGPVTLAAPGSFLETLFRGLFSGLPIQKLIVGTESAVVLNKPSR